MNVFYNACMSEGGVVIFVVSVCDQSIASVVVDESSFVFIKPMGQTARCLPEIRFGALIARNLIHTSFRFYNRARRFV